MNIDESELKKPENTSAQVDSPANALASTPNRTPGIISMLLAKMIGLAERHRNAPSLKVAALVDWTIEFPKPVGNGVSIDIEIDEAT
ncbi:MAG: hypothetical protein ABL921_33075 [Pirellula sp.]